MGRALVAMFAVWLAGVAMPEVASARPGHHAHTRKIVVAGHAKGRRFDGVGALSGGGGNARYLVDYPRQARNAILDELFRPGYGAGLQMLKVEIGGDANTTDGAEASIEHRRGIVDCDAGYEWWLMRQAKDRNPHIRLYALAWSAPGWTRTFWSRRTIRYLVGWLRCARGHGLHIDYLGGTQNEGRDRKQYDPGWTEALRAAMDRAGFRSTRLTMSEAFDPEGRWRVAKDLARHRAFRRATGVIADHDVCGYPTNGLRCRSTRVARRLGLPLWASELGGVEGDAGAPGTARAIIRGYATARLVGYITWPLMAGMPPGLPHRTDGLISAVEPWSGHYDVHAMTYALAMVTWFTAPGWRYVNGANGILPRGGGSYETLRAPDHAHWSTIAETTAAKHSTRVRLGIRHLRSRRVRVWRSDLSSARGARRMVRRHDIRPRHGRFAFRLRPGYVYTFTTLDRRRHAASAAAPSRRRFGSYVDRPARRSLGRPPRYLAAMDGAFVHRPCWDDRTRLCTQQMAPRAPVFWHVHRAFPYAVLGDESLRDYTVSTDVRFRDAGASAGVIARFSAQARSISEFRGYVLDLAASGRWVLLRNSRQAGMATLASGNLAPSAGWHALALGVRGADVTATVDGTQVASVDDPVRGYGRGIAGIEAGAQTAATASPGAAWPIVQYRGLTVAPTRPPGPAATGPAT